jgi:hypothetical protein
LFIDIDGEIIINSRADWAMGYKYNAADYILGGELKIMAKNLAKETMEEYIEGYLINKPHYDQGSNISQGFEMDRREGADVDLEDCHFYA